MTRIWFTVNDLKQYMYCPRVVFYYAVMPVDRKTTYKMARGQLSQEQLERLEVRRKLTKYGLTEGKRQLNVYLSAGELALSGKLDCLIISSESEYIPVDFKDTLANRVPANHAMQLTAYAMLIESNFGTKVSRGFIYAIPQKTTFLVNITTELKEKVLDILDKIDRMVTMQLMPEKSNHQARCQDCEFRNFCGDVF